VRDPVEAGVCLPEEMKVRGKPPDAEVILTSTDNPRLTTGDNAGSLTYTPDKEDGAIR
jgi:hypothetical protein